VQITSLFQIQATASGCQNFPEQFVAGMLDNVVCRWWY